MEAYTVKDLRGMCDALIAGGRGDRKILISNDDEGNGYHELFFGFTAPDGLLKSGTALLPFGVTAEQAVKDYIILG